MRTSFLGPPRGPVGRGGKGSGERGTTDWEYWEDWDYVRVHFWFGRTPPTSRHSDEDDDDDDHDRRHPQHRPPEEPRRVPGGFHSGRSRGPCTCHLSLFPSTV